MLQWPKAHAEKCQDIPLIAKDATFLISLATEEFIKRLSEAGRRVAEREKRSTVQHKDIGAIFPPHLCRLTRCSCFYSYCRAESGRVYIPRRYVGSIWPS